MNSATLDIYLTQKLERYMHQDLQDEERAKQDSLLQVHAAVFGNHLILENILRHLSTANLRNVQPVNKMWNTIASAILKKDRRLKLKFNYETSSDFIRSVAAPRANLATVYEWEIGCINNWKSENFEDCQAKIETLNALIAEDATGKLVAGLTLELYAQMYSAPEHSERIFSYFERILCSVKKLGVLNLDLAEYWYSILPREHKFNIQNLQLPHLEELSFAIKRRGYRDSIKPICKLVMNAAPNLKVINGVNVSHIWDVIVECGKGHCVKSYTIEQQEKEKDKWDMVVLDINTLIEQAPALESLVLHHNLFSSESPWFALPSEVLTAVHRLLIHYQKSLRYIRTAELAFLDYLIKVEEDIPVFENLEFLSIATTRLDKILPCVSLMKNQFPSLAHVKLELEGLTEDCLTTYFPRHRYKGENPRVCSLPTVRKLELKDRYNKRGMHILCQLFPNVKDIKFYQIIGEYTHSMQTGLWNMPPSVESLTLHFMAMDYTKQLDNFDLLFTGISKRALAKLPRDVAQDAYLTIASRNGVRQLKALKRLRIIFDMDESRVVGPLYHYYYNYSCSKPERIVSPDFMRECMEFPFFIKKGTFTVLSSLYAFSSPNFETYIHYDNRLHCAAQIENMIQELQPHVIAAPSHRSQLKPDVKDIIAIAASNMGVEVQPLPANVPALEERVPEDEMMDMDSNSAD